MKSWGYVQMLILSSVILFFLAVVVYNVHIFNSHFNLEVSTNYYKGLESQLEERSLAYLSTYYNHSLSSDKIIVTKDMLSKYGLDIALYDKSNNICKGYVLANKEFGEVNTRAYIACNEYKTSGYEDWRL